MADNENEFDTLDYDAQLVQQAGIICDSMTAIEAAVQNSKKIVDEQHEAVAALQAESKQFVEDALAQKEELKAILKKINEQIEVLNKKTAQQQEVLEEMQRLDDSIHSTFDEFKQQHKNTVEMITYFEKRISALEEKNGGAASAAPATAKPVHEKAPEQQKPVREFKRFENVDYDEITSVENLVQKYSGKIEGPVIVTRRVKFPWGDNYCMAIKNINKGKAWGVRYNYGKEGKHSPITDIKAEEYSMYDGEDYWQVAEDFMKNGK